MSDQTSRFVGTFSGIHFGVKQKKEKLVQTAGFNFDVELDETSLSQVAGIIGLQKQPVYLAVSRRQPGLFDGKPPAGEPEPQGKLPLAGPADGGPTADSPAVDPVRTWYEIDVLGPDKKLHSILRRADGLAFYCFDCGEGIECDPGEDIDAGIRNHACAMDGPLPELQRLEATVEVPCKDGVTRTMGYTIEHWKNGNGPAFDCEECGEIVGISEQEADEQYLPLERMAAHVCPPVCHKCHAEMKYGAVFAESLRFHHPECPQAKLHDPEVPVATALDVQGADPYAARVEVALDEGAREFLLEDATEAFARLQEECGMARSVGRKDRNEFKAAHTISKKDRKAVLAEAKKASKGAWNRMTVLLQDIDAAKAVHDLIAKKEREEEQRRREEEWERERRERAQAEKVRIIAVLAGEPQPYDEMLREVLYREEKTQRNWILACERGAESDRVKMMINTAFGKDGGLNVPGKTSISWKTGWSPKLWVGPAAGAPTLAGDDLIDAVRRIMRIPAPPPAPEEAPDAEEENERACRACGCTEFDPCIEGCSWVEQDLCSHPDCLEMEEYTPEEIAQVEAGKSPRASAKSPAAPTVGASAKSLSQPGKVSDGACRICGCTEATPCPEGCFTVEDDLCGNPKCLKAAGYTQKAIANLMAERIP